MLYAQNFDDVTLAREIATSEELKANIPLKVV